MPPPPTIDTLLRLAAAPDSTPALLTAVTAHPHLAHAADANGYTLLHAAASYDSPTLLESLITTHAADPNVRDSDGDTPLFYAETPATARALVALGADPTLRNADGIDALANAQANADAGDDGDWAAVAAYLGGLRGAAVAAPPPLPPGVSIDVSAGAAAEEADAVADPEFRARIEALAARDDFAGAEGQAELRRLVEDAVGGLRAEGGEGDGKRRAR